MPLTPLEKQLRYALETNAYFHTKMDHGPLGVLPVVICRECARYDKNHAPDCAIGGALYASREKEE